MKTVTLIVVSLAFLSPRPVVAQASHHSVVKEVCTMESRILAGERRYAIYLPAGYKTSERSYPVLYLLHGSGDDQTGWVQFGELQHIADKAIEDGDATPMVVVMPDADTGRKGYFNDIRGDWDYEDFLITELIPHIEETYRVKSEKRYRAVAGLSMGGGGAFMYALHHPELFSSSCPLSASTGPLNLDDARRRYNRSRDRDSGVALEPVTDEKIVEYFQQHSAVKLAETLPVEDLSSVRWYIDCGDDDFLYEGNSLVHIALRKRKVPHEFRIRDGEHRWSYWRSALPQVLRFVSESFHQR